MALNCFIIISSIDGNMRDVQSYDICDMSRLVVKAMYYNLYIHHCAVRNKASKDSVYTHLPFLIGLCCPKSIVVHFSNIKLLKIP